VPAGSRFSGCGCRSPKPTCSDGPAAGQCPFQPFIVQDEAAQDDARRMAQMADEGIVSSICGTSFGWTNEPI